MRGAPFPPGNVVNPSLDGPDARQLALLEQQRNLHGMTFPARDLAAELRELLARPEFQGADCRPYLAESLLHLERCVASMRSALVVITNAIDPERIGPLGRVEAAAYYARNFVKAGGGSIEAGDLTPHGAGNVEGGKLS